jgi:hypothetical protein
MSADIYAECYTDNPRLLKKWDVKEIGIVRAKYVWGMDNPESVKCFYNIAKLEAEVAILKGEFSSAEGVAEEILRAFPGDYSGLLFMHLALNAQDKSIPEWYSVKRYPNEYSKRKLLNNLSNSIILEPA